MANRLGLRPRALAALSTLLVLSASAHGVPSPEEVAPGVWKIRFGEPEALTPIKYRSGPPQVERMRALPQVAAVPLPPDQASFVAAARGCSLELPMTRDERVYGLGLNLSSFEMSNQRAFIVPGDHPENNANTSHAPVPFYVSSRGFGVYVDTARFASFYTGGVTPTSKPPAGDRENADAASAAGTEDLYRARAQRERTMLIDVPAARGVDVYVFAGPTPADVVRRYNLFSGGGCVPPMWGLGIYYRGLNKFTADDSLKLARQIRDQHMPCDVWGVEPGWQTKTYSCSFLWNTQAFPDPDGFLKQMQAMGYRTNLWEHAFTHPSSPIHDALAPWSGNYRVWGGLVPDFATPQARKIFVDHHERTVFSKGISGVKLDECDHQPFRATNVWSFPENSAFPSGLDGEQMHSLIGVLYQQTLLEPYTRRNLRTWGLARNSHALAAPLPYSIYTDAYDHRCFVRGLAKASFQGLLWCPEVRNADSVEDLYRRTQTAIFSPLAQINCWFLRMPPWMQVNRAKNNAGEVMPESADATAVMRKLFDLRMSFIPYLYSAFNEYRLTGTPPMRAMLLDWPDDPETWTLDDQFMFGPSVLVAPMFAGQASRDVYLPKGDWYDFWTGEKFAGGKRVTVTKPADTIPLFVKAGTLLPLAKPVERVSDDTRFELDVCVYGTGPASFTLLEDDGVTGKFAQGAQNPVDLLWSAGQGSVRRAAANSELPKRYTVASWTRVAE